MEEKELSKGTKIKVAIVTVLVILTTLAGISYAFFSIGVTGNEEASSVTVTAALLRLSYSDNLSIGGSGIYPGWSQSKTITVENTGTDTVYYKIIWRELLNQIINDELTISATCVANSGTCPTISETPISTYLSQTSNVDIKDKIEIAPGVIHTYTVTVTFKEMSSAQNYNQGKSFYGTLNIVEGKKPVRPVATGETYESMPIVTIGTEEFYDITNVVNYSSLDSSFLIKINYDSSKSILLARYNLYVGQICTRVNSNCVYTEISNLVDGYGFQSSDSVGLVPFSGSSTNYGYWDSSGSGIDSKYGTYTGYANNIYDTTYSTAPNYSVAFYNNAGNANYSVAHYVEEYINTLGVEGTGRLLTYPEANAMTQAQRANGQGYWLGSAKDNVILNIISRGGPDDGVFMDDSFINYRGVRPVIVVNTSDIQSS